MLENPWQIFLSAEQMNSVLLEQRLQPVEYVCQRDAIDSATWERTDSLPPFDLSVPARASVPAR
ncbi:hypothetical protein [Streptomyces abikoensis]|uniref:hypothetical protein n=1 Tax=Streptomyces abikoensis TaxID=97398 RepID=UPI001671B2BD|nr:hypothetical protein [Streptomyces abikoensis]GGP44775.1 hypothetical protein GCM10010214_17070 [Streptomyces abikoensis]